ncbi:MAG: HEAT repeat domain-containing protein [Candidatus Omnitrophica bacterium]|nr:HEAT repeat domain-containing protein [Candidatus Omnitrophota bacterium]
MTQDTLTPEIKNTEEKKSVFGVIVHSFFVVPFLIAIFSVLLYASVRILTMENRTVYDYLQDVKVGGITKRWQSAFELSKILANSKLVPTENRFETELIDIFEKSVDDDPRVRQYLALAMGRTGNQNYASSLIKNLTNEKDENLTAFIYSLGILKSIQAVDPLIMQLKSDNPRVRLVSTMALGSIAGDKAIRSLKEMLSDPEPNVQWEAAVALAKNQNGAGKELILKLLDRNYLSQFSNVDPEEQTHVMITAIQSAAQLRDDQLATRFEEISKSDKNMKVRDAAFRALESYRKSS